MVTEDVRDSQAVLDELNDSGDPYYVAYVRDEMRHDLVEVPQRRRNAADIIGSASADEDVEMQTIEGVEPGAAAPPSKAPEAIGGDYKAHTAVDKDPTLPKYGWPDEGRPYDQW